MTAGAGFARSMQNLHDPATPREMAAGENRRDFNLSAAITGPGIPLAHGYAKSRRLRSVRVESFSQEVLQ
ncbi:MAG: hypothetical protein HPY67_01970 [Syntrophaceae bacterium]|nr:hypothetical protein [Syntrophaceae bacterium]